VQELRSATCLLLIRSKPLEDFEFSSIVVKLFDLTSLLYGLGGRVDRERGLVSFWGSSEVNDGALVHLDGLTHITSLDLRDTDITDAGLEHVKGLSDLRRLYLDGTQVTDAGMKHLQGLILLQTLTLGRTQVSDACLGDLKALASLRSLDLTDTLVTGAGVQDFKKALPKVWIATSAAPALKPPSESMKTAPAARGRR